MTDITYIRTWAGLLYLAVVMDLYSRKIVGWSMKTELARELVLDALLMAVWRRKPDERGAGPLGSGLAVRELRLAAVLPGSRAEAEHEPSRQLLGQRGRGVVLQLAEEGADPPERIYKTRDEARADVFDYIEMFYNPKRRHSHVGGVSPEAFEAASCAGR